MFVQVLIIPCRIRCPADTWVLLDGWICLADRTPIMTITQLGDPVLGPEYLYAIGKVKEADITNGSKGNTLSKGVALTQGLWFITQRPPTLAFAVVNVFIWRLWWAKPLAVQQPIALGLPEEPDKAEHAVLRLDLGERFNDVIIGIYLAYDPKAATSVPSFWSAQGHADDFHPSFFIKFLVGMTLRAIQARPSLRAPRSSLFALLSGLNGLAYISIPEILYTLVWILVVPAISIYIIARIFLVAIPFASLRALSPGALIDVDWSVYIPHL
ncbi:hypothetical protein C8R44DRAFT_893325 [Mycena epipterygia]|nr:hypothetical protein C8R44DRAFT_893325 [Mycena epipterygia]